jgi:hypothetical protein
MLRFVLSILFIQSVTWAQDDILGLEIDSSATESQPAPPPKKKGATPRPPSVVAASAASEPAQNQAAPATAQQSVRLDEYFNTWNARKVRQGFGYSPILNLAQYDRWITPKWGFFVGLRNQKTQDSFIENRTTSYNQTTLSLSDTTSFSGARNPTVINMVIGGKSRIWQNDWMQVNWGGFLMYTHGTSVSYATGSTTRTAPNVNTPNDYTMNENALGSTSSGVDPTYSLGVKVGSEFYIKWFPNLALCADIVFLNQLPLKGTTETSTATKTYNVVSGVAQAPTAESYNTNRVYNDYGGAASTGQVGASYFNLLGANWSIKYVW